MIFKLLYLTPLLLSSVLFAELSHENIAHTEVISNEKQTQLYDTEDENKNKDLFEKQGLLISEDCAIKGSFSSCNLESYACGFEGCWQENEPGINKPVQLVLFVHDDGKYYKIELTDEVKRYYLDEGVNRNEIIIIGKYNKAEDFVNVTEFKTPPPPSKSFFKGCL
jgi:hypothetical protein